MLPHSTLCPSHQYSPVCLPRLQGAPEEAQRVLFVAWPGQQHHAPGEEAMQPQSSAEVEAAAPHLPADTGGPLETRVSWEIEEEMARVPNCKQLA